MRSFLSAGALAIVLAFSGQSVAFSAQTQAPGGVMERGYIVEFEDASPHTGLFPRSEDHHAAFHEHLSKRDEGGIEYETRESYTHAEIFSGVSIKLANDEHLHHVRRAPGVKAVHPIRTFSRPTANFVHASKEAVKAACQSEDGFAPHVMTQVDRLHKKGHYGKGVTVAIIDSGVDYKHPALNGGLPSGEACYGKPECQIIGGYDFVGNDSNSPKQSNDPYSGCPAGDHGTHIAGIIAGNDTAIGFLGVVPQAKIRMYRVYPCAAEPQAPETAPAKREGPGLGGEIETPGNEDVFLSALLRAFKDGNDLITCSFGNPGGWINGPLSSVASRIAAQGVPVTISGGNDGAQGAFFTDDPASAEFGASVAIVQSTNLVGFSAELEGAGKMKELFIASAEVFDFPANQSRTLQVYVANDNCTNLPEDDNDGKLGVVWNRDCKDLLFAKGFNYVVAAFEQAPASTEYFRDDEPGIQSANVYREDALKLRHATAAGKRVSITFDAAARMESRHNKIDGGLLNAMASFGPTNDMVLNPQIAAPGGNIFSAVPLGIGPYAVFSGSSMAAPYFAGVVSQYISIKGKAPSIDIRSRFMAHSKPIAENNSPNSMLASLGRAGSGLVQAYDSIFASATAFPGQLALNDSVHFQGEHWVTIKNIGEKTHKYTTSHLPVGTAQTSNTSVPGDTAWNVYPLPLTTEYASVKFSPSTFTLAPGAERKVKVTFKPPRTSQKKFPVYSGLVKFNSDNARASLSVPYIGLASDISKRPVLDPTARKGFNLPALTTPQGEAFEQSLGEPVVDLTDVEKTLSVSYALSFGSPLFEIAIVAADTVYDASIKNNKLAPRNLVEAQAQELSVNRRLHPRDLQLEETIDFSTGAPVNQTNAALFSDVVTIGIAQMARFQARSFDGEPGITLVNLTSEVQRPDNTTFELPEGRYRTLLRAQRTATNASRAASYDSWISEPFEYRKGA